MPIIVCRDVSKHFPARRGTRVMLGRGGLGDWIRGRGRETFAALKNISFTVEPGESLGIIGRNGSGKSTLLKILGGVTLPTSGQAIVQGRVASLLELGAGFHPMLTGRENVYLNAGLLGMRHKQVDEVFDQIVAFSGIGEFIDQPVDTYSSGMYVRIGFAVAAHTNPDIFLVDEVLSVGDEEFQRKCRRKIGELREQGKTIVFVSHDLGIVNTLCQRVILLNRGEMLLRDTPQKTINYYLRQVGRDKGVHTFADADAEAIHCDGRISLFHRQEELTSATGCQMFLTALGQHHASTDAEWEVTEAGPEHCIARGRMTRLPASLVWEMRLQDGRFVWKASIDCERPVDLSQIEAVLYLPTLYEHWLYGDLSGRFPDILPSDAAWNIMAAPEISEMEGAVVPAQGASVPPVMVELTPHRPHLGMYWANSEYVLFSRVLNVYERLPENDCTFPVGRHDFMTLTLDMTLQASDLRRRVQTQRTLACGGLSARFEQGKIRLACDGEEITAFLHVYSSMLVEQLWHDSLSLQWGPVRAEGRCLSLSGESRRFPFRQHWTLTALDEAVSLDIELEALETFEVQEYHVSVLLRPEYEKWETDHEQGEFPPFDPALGVWKHLNRSYAPGNRARALSFTLPSVIFEITAGNTPFRMTPINTRLNQNARVLQALRPADTGTIQFEKGRHPYFSGIIRVERGNR